MDEVIGGNIGCAFYYQVKRDIWGVTDRLSLEVTPPRASNGLTRLKDAECCPAAKRFGGVGNTASTDSRHGTPPCRPRADKPMIRTPPHDSASGSWLK